MVIGQSCLGEEAYTESLILYLIVLEEQSIFDIISVVLLSVGRPLSITTVQRVPGCQWWKSHRSQSEAQLL